MKKAVALLLLIAISGFSQDIRIACVGNSITNMGSSRFEAGPDSYPVQLRYLMGEGFDIRNFGIVGATMLKQGDVSYWDNVIFSDVLEFDPNIITIMLGTNDSKPLNWDPHKNEFKNDYKAMIDTFQTLPSNPQVYLCLPAKIFDNTYTITDSNLVKIIEIIKEIAVEYNLPTIDCYSFFEDKPYLTTDGVHPNYNGLWEYAKLIYLGLTGQERPVTQIIHDVNLVKGMPVSIEGQETLAPITEMTDRDYFTRYPIENGAVVELALGTAASIDMVQILVDNYYSFNYKIEASLDEITWNELGTENADSASASSLPFDAVDAQFLKITFNHEEPVFNVAEIGVFQTAQVHAPAITFVVGKVFTRKMQYYVDLYAASKDAPIRLVYRLGNGEYDGGTDYRADATLQFKHSVNKDVQTAYYTMAYDNGFEVISDTLYVDYQISSVEPRETALPSQFQLYQNYPNPFNPSTVIEYDLNRAGHVHLAIVDCTGRLVKDVVNTHQAAGSYRAHFDASGLSSGLYFYVLESGQKKTTRKMVLMH